MMMFLAIKNDMQNSFRPLSRGPFFNTTAVMVVPLDGAKQVFVPFLGDLFSITDLLFANFSNKLFSSPFSGTFFQWERIGAIMIEKSSFRPLSRGPFFNCKGFQSRMYGLHVFVPFLGDLFSISMQIAVTMLIACFRPLSRGPFFNSVPAKPQPVCSRKHISGGDGGSLHQALSFGDEMPIFPVRTGIGGDLQ